VSKFFLSIRAQSYWFRVYPNNLFLTWSVVQTPFPNEVPFTGTVSTFLKGTIQFVTQTYADMHGNDKFQILGAITSGEEKECVLRKGLKGTSPTMGIFHFLS
jgi:hypothetical protein